MSSYFKKDFNFKVIIYKGLLFSGLMLFFIACDTKTEGCLDATATNFDPSADTDCCCTYPKLYMRLSYNLYSRDSSGFALNTTYNDDFGNPFQVSSMPFYIAQFQVVNSSGALSGVTDQVALYFNNGTTQIVEDNYQIVKPNVFQYEIGTFETTGDFTQIRFLVGLDATANQTLPDSMESTHVLAIQSDSLYISNSEGYIFNKANLITDTSSTTITTYNIQGDANLVEVILNAPITIQKGADTEYKLNLDYLKFFEGVNFQTDDAATITSKIKTNTVNAFSLQ